MVLDFRDEVVLGFGGCWLLVVLKQEKFCAEGDIILIDRCNLPRATFGLFYLIHVVADVHVS